MVDIPDSKNKTADAHGQGAGMSAPDAKLWFVREVLPLEAVLMQFLRHNWRNESDVNDIRQDVYIRVFEAAKQKIPESSKAFVFATARNLLIDRVRKGRIVPIEAATDFVAQEAASDEPGPDRSLIARDELRRLNGALERLPKRCREAFLLLQVQDLTRREIAARMGISEKTVNAHLSDAMRMLADIVYGEPPDLKGAS